MRLFLALLMIGIFNVTGAFANSQQPPSLDLEATSKELRTALKLQPNIFGGDFQKEDVVEHAIEIGERLLTWVDLINSKRPDDKKLRLTSPLTRRGIPITAPNHYSPRSIEADLNSAQAQMPVAMKDILFSDVPLTIENPISDEDFAKYGRLMDRVYQTAARWKMLIPYKGFLTANRVKDIRGYYYLTTNHWNTETLQSWGSIPVTTQTEIREALFGTCLNSRGPIDTCKRNAEAVNDGATAVNLYNQYMPTAARVYNSFFAIQNARSDISWSTKRSAAATIPFFDPVRVDVRNFIKENIEDEYSWLGWGLKIEFVPRKPAPYIVFIPGQTANVEGLGGNKIEMDANKSLGEYEEQWTIRHEFGHVLGLPDCYHEFYDADNEEFINYQIDITDLMCSRAGNMTQRIYDQLKDAYMR